MSENTAVVEWSPNGDGDGTATVSEIIGRDVLVDVQVSLYKSRFKVRTIDQTIPDYAFFDRLRRGKQQGYTLGGLFAQRIERVIASWVLGDGFDVTLRPGDDIDPNSEAVQYTNSKLAEFVAGLLDSGTDADDEDTDPADLDRDDNQNSLLLSIYRDTLGLGDQYVIVNADGSLSVPSPDTVTEERDPLDYRRVIAVRVETKLPEFTIVDEYRADGRTVTVKEGAKVVDVQEYENLIGRIQVIHLAHGRSANETNGHPIHDELRPLYDEYDDLIYKQLDGAKLLGNPIPFFYGLKDPQAIYDANQPVTEDTYFDKDGNEVTRKQFKLDTNSVVIMGEGGDGKFLAPPTGFTEDTKTGLKSLFLLLLDHTGIPEFIWGNELSSARASSDTQMQQFVKDIQGWRRDVGGWIVRLCKIWLQTMAVLNPALMVGRLQLTWPELLGEDQALKLEQIKYGHMNGLLTDRSALSLLELVDDVDNEIEEAEAEAEERRQREFPDGDTALFQQRLEEDEQGEADSE